MESHHGIEGRMMVGKCAQCISDIIEQSFSVRRSQISDLWGEVVFLDDAQFLRTGEVIRIVEWAIVRWWSAAGAAFLVGARPAERCQ